MIDWVDQARRWVPPRLRYGIQRFISFSEIKRRWRASSDPLCNVIESDGNRAGCSVRVGILANRAQFHTKYVRACQEMGIPFRVLDLCRSDSLATIEGAGCGLFLAWPDATQSPWAGI